MNALTSQIEAVTVYFRGALVRRVAELQTEGGVFPASLRLGGLPLSLDDASLRVRFEPAGDGRPAALPIATDLRVALEIPDRDARLAPADNAELEVARLEERRLAERVSRLERALAQMALLAPLDRPAGKEGEPPGDTPLAARLSLVAFRRGREEALHAELRAAREVHAAAKRQRVRLEDLDRRSSSARQAHEHELRKAALISVVEREAGAEAVRVVAEYYVPGAYWAPAYSLEIDGPMRTAHLSRRAIVAQKSGEDWMGAMLTLSTADAHGWTELPELSSLRIGRRQPRPARKGWRPPPAGAEALYQDWDRAFAHALPRPAPPSARTVAIGADERLGPSGLDEEEIEAGFAYLQAANPEKMRAPKASVAPVSPSGAAPMPQGPLQAKRGGPASIVAAAVAAPAALAADVRARLGGARTAAGEDARTFAGPPPGAPAAFQDALPKGAGHGPTPAQPDPTEPGELLRYGALRMPPAQSAQRGRLTLATRTELYLALLVEQQVTIEVDAASAVDAARAAAERTDRTPPGFTRAWSEHYDYAYIAAAEADVPSDGEFHNIPLGRCETTASPLYVVVPRESVDVFRTARVENPTDAPLLPGPVDVSWRGEFLLTSQIPLTPPRGQFRLGLGVEQAIKVARNTRFSEETSGLMGGRLALHHQIAIELRNGLDRPAAVEVRERLPVTSEGEEEIEVVTSSVSPAWAPWEPEAESPGEPKLRGGHRWLVTVPAGGRQDLRVDYEVRLSAKHELVGGNRREG